MDKEELKDYIDSFYKEFKIMPLLSDIANAFGVKNKGSVHYALKKLIKEGFLVKVGHRIAPGLNFSFPCLYTNSNQTELNASSNA